MFVVVLRFVGGLWVFCFPSGEVLRLSPGVLCFGMVYFRRYLEDAMVNSPARVV